MSDYESPIVSNLLLVFNFMLTIGYIPFPFLLVFNIILFHFYLISIKKLNGKGIEDKRRKIGKGIHSSFLDNLLFSYEKRKGNKRCQGTHDPLDRSLVS